VFHLPFCFSDGTCRRDLIPVSIPVLLVTPAPVIRSSLTSEGTRGRLSVRLSSHDGSHLKWQHNEAVAPSFRDGLPLGLGPWSQCQRSASGDMEIVLSSADGNSEVIE